jgi:hypothetical protein
VTFPQNGGLYARRADGSSDFPTHILSSIPSPQSTLTFKPELKFSQDFGVRYQIRYQIRSSVFHNNNNTVRSSLWEFLFVIKMEKLR